MKKIFYLTALAVMVLASCSKDNGTDNILSPEGAKAGLSIRMAFPSTYAGDEVATTAESTVKTVDVFIFDAGDNTLVTHRHLLKTDFEPKPGDIYATKEDVVTTAGNRKVAIGVNLPASIVTKVTTLGEIDAVNDQTVHDVTVADIASADNFAMFNVDMDQTVAVTAGGSNSVLLSIERLAGKAALATVNGFDFSSSAIATQVNLESLEYRLMQTNLQSYLMRDPSGKDPNYLYANFTPGDPSVFPEYGEDVFENTTDADYKTVGAYLSDNSSRPAFYGAENTSDFYQKATTTYFLVRALFSPKEFTDGAGDADDQALADYTPGEDDFWIVTDGTATYFCDTEAKAADLSAVGGLFSGTITITKHEEGYCYWSVWIGNKNEHDFLRNNYYLGQISAFNGFGAGSEEDVIDPPTGSVDDEEVASIECQFTILNWNFNMADPVELN